jgi:hypothetical protein
MHPTEVLSEIFLPHETCTGAAFTVLDMAEYCFALLPVYFSVVA